MNHTRRQKNRDETLDFLKPLTIPKLAKPFTPRTTAQAKPHKPPARLPPSDNKLLLAGYLAREFLTKGTLFGEPWNPARAEAVPVSAAANSADYRKPVSQKEKPVEPKPGEKRKFESYNEVTGILMGNNGVHIPGIVNPTQLIRFLNLQ
ncbi:uncharacterized protein [Rutidosis leptorrhynchoides]|uniref:uncharacterized protein n=1 Tax=Rutidosis leptorrhynchoides TaxID=125765 RepID=UPI003A9901A9